MDKTDGVTDLNYIVTLSSTSYATYTNSLSVAVASANFELILNFPYTDGFVFSGGTYRFKI